jgi:pimeloyl-ACP methyl ester carboxylesterase
VEPTIEYIEANGLRFAYREEGSGPLVVMLHGFPDTPSTWSHLRPAVAAAGFRVVTPFLRGYAPTQIPERDTDLRTMGMDVHGLIDALGGGPAVVIGHDWGAVSAYAAAAQRPENISKLVTMAIPHLRAMLPTFRLLWGFRHVLAHRLPGAAAGVAADDYAQLKVLFARWSPTWKYTEEDLAPIKAALSEPGCLDATLGYYRAMPLMGAPRWLSRRLPMPALLFHGLDDPIMGPAPFERSRRYFEGSFDLAAVPGGHFLHRESPEQVAQRVLEFLGAYGS